MWRFHKPHKAPQHTPTNFHEKTVSRLGTSAIVAGTRMCRPVTDTETLLIVGLGEAKLKCERLPQGADRSFESPGHFRLEPKSSRLTPQPWPLVPWVRWGSGRRWPNCRTAPPPEVLPSHASDTEQSLGSLYMIFIGFFPLITEEIWNHHKKCFLRKWHKDNKKPPVLLLSPNKH